MAIDTKLRLYDSIYTTEIIESAQYLVVAAPLS
jgi:hypothetical protein